MKIKLGQILGFLLITTGLITAEHLFIERELSIFMAVVMGIGIFFAYKQLFEFYKNQEEKEEKEEKKWKDID